MMATMSVPHKRWNFQKSLTRFVQYLVMVVFALIVLVPVALLIFGGLKTRGEWMQSPYTPPFPPRIENYAWILSQPGSWLMLRNSLSIMISTTAGVVFVSALAAFVFARLHFKGKALTFNILTLSLLFPLSIAVLPVYLLLRQLNLLNLGGVILPQIAFGLAGNILILRGFFTSIPVELQEAAYIDGCTAFGFFWRILLPLARPALSAIAVLTMIGSWNEYFLPLVVLNDDKLWPLPLGTMQFVGEHGSDQAMVLAFVTLTMIPVIIFYIFAERQIVSGLMAGAIKG
jgi:raffinose/stachyose/melibiose transport system permease protein